MVAGIPRLIKIHTCAYDLSQPMPGALHRSVNASPPSPLRRAALEHGPGPLHQGAQLPPAGRALPQGAPAGAAQGPRRPVQLHRPAAQLHGGHVRQVGSTVTHQSACPSVPHGNRHETPENRHETPENRFIRVLWKNVISFIVNYNKCARQIVMVK